MKVYRGSASAARTYVESDRSRVDDYYLAEGTGLAERHVAVSAAGESAGRGTPGVHQAGVMDGDAYEAWVAGVDPATGVSKGRLRTDGQAVRFVEVVINGPKTWSLAASVHPEVSAAYDAAQDRAAGEVIGWLAEHATTRVGPRGRQVQVPVEELEAAVVRHHTSRAGDPHRHLHLQINARVWARGAWRGLHTVGVRESLDAINGIGQAAMQCDPHFRAVLARHGYTIDAATGDIEQLKAFAPAFSARAAQIGRNVDRYEAQWRSEHPGQEPGPRLRQAWDTRAWAQARPDKVVPRDGTELRQRWHEELTDLGFHPPTPPSRDAGLPALAAVAGPRIGQLNRDVFVQVALIRLGAKRSGWNAADVRGELERLIVSAGLIAEPAARDELVEDLTARTLDACVPLLQRHDVPEHIRALTSAQVLSVEHELTTRLTHRAHNTAGPAGPRQKRLVGADHLDVAQQRVATELIDGPALLVIEGAAGAGKTSTLAAAQHGLEAGGRSRMVVVTPTLKAAEVAAAEIGTQAFSAAWLAHQHGFRWDNHGHWTRLPATDTDPQAVARLSPGDLLVVDEAGMLDQDTALAVLTVADEAGARIALIGDRHQLPAVGRGGVLDLATNTAPEYACLSLNTVHRFTDPDYADLTLAMRTGHDPAAVFDTLHARGEIRIHPSETERLQHLTHLTAPTEGMSSGRALIVADTRDQVTALNAAIRDHRLTQQPPGVASTGGSRGALPALVTDSGERIGVGDTITTRRNDRTLKVANRQTWTVTALGPDGSITIAHQPIPSAASGKGTHGQTQGGTQGGTPVTTQGGTRAKPQVSRGERTLPNDYVQAHVELAYARTVYGAQGETVDAAHFVLGEQTGAASAYVAMTRGRHHNTAHLVAETVDEAREQWVAVFARDRADLGPARAAERAAEDIDRYGGLDWEMAEAIAITESFNLEVQDEHDRKRAVGPERARQGPSR
ncbi:MAG: ATP-dependent exoDNAse [Nocardioides sp.]|nr:ATP-dependent exoDNAse [Nocardioides sp.]